MPIFCVIAFKFPVRINNGVDFRRDFHPDDFERHFKQWSPDYQ